MNLKANEFWALYNCSNFWCAHKTQRECKKEASEAMGKPWGKEMEECFQIVKVVITPAHVEDKPQ